MPENQCRISKRCCSRKNNVFRLFDFVNYCIRCSSFLIKNFYNFESKNTINKTIKPPNFELNEDYIPNLQWLIQEDKLVNFLNKKEYKRYRASTIKNMKKICNVFSLSLKTYFLSIEYLDIISSKISTFQNNILSEISLICILLAVKFNENNQKAFEVQKALKLQIKKNYAQDEVYILQLLEYDLNIYTSYDKLMDILFYGFVFENETINKDKLLLIYYNIQKILYLFSESNSYIEITSKQIALGMIGFARELLCLAPFPESIQEIFINNNIMNKSLCLSSLNIIKKKIKIQNSDFISNNPNISCRQNLEIDKKNNKTQY